MQVQSTTSGREAPTPPFTWEGLERALKRMAASPEQAAMTSNLVAATRLRSVALPADQVLEEIVCMASLVADETWFGGSKRNSVPAE